MKTEKCGTIRQFPKHHYYLCGYSFYKEVGFEFFQSQFKNIHM